MSESIICPRCKQRVEVITVGSSTRINGHYRTVPQDELCPASNLPIRGNYRGDPTYQCNEPPARELLVELEGDDSG